MQTDDYITNISRLFWFFFCTHIISNGSEKYVDNNNTQ